MNIAVFIAKVAVIQIEVAGLQAENQQRAHLGQCPAYTEQTFFEAVERLKNLTSEFEKGIEQ